jgi:formate-dependent nitrite reductase membrane component NrfD
MVRPITNVPVSDLPKPPFPRGRVATTLFILGLCSPLIWYVLLLDERYGPEQSLTDVAHLELLTAIVLLSLPFLVLRLLRVDWRGDKEK